MKKYALFILVFAFAISLASVAFAQVNPVPGSGIIPADFDLAGNALGQEGAVSSQDTLIGVVVRLIQWVAWIVGLLAVLMGLYAGILFITASGDAAKIEKARGILLYAIVGIVVAIIAFGLVAISTAIIGV